MQSTFIYIISSDLCNIPFTQVWQMLVFNLQVIVIRLNDLPSGMKFSFMNFMNCWSFKHE